MSSQHVCLHRSVRVMTALALAFVLVPPPASSAAPGGPASAGLLRKAPVRQGAASPFIDNDVDPWDDDLDGGKTPPPPPVIGLGEELFRLVEDDLDGVSLCTTSIGSAKTMVGALREDTGEEALFFFRLPVTAVVMVEAVSNAALQLVLRDSNDLAVAVTRSEDAGTPLRLVRTLAAGRYFLEVESLNGGDSVYALTLHRPGRP